MQQIRKQRTASYLLRIGAWSLVVAAILGA